MKFHGRVFAFEGAVFDKTFESIFFFHFLSEFIGLNFDERLNEGFGRISKRFKSAMRALVSESPDVLMADELVALVAADGLFAPLHADDAVVFVTVRV